MSIAWQEPHLTPRWLWRLRRPYRWSYPHGWGWEGPTAGGRTMTLRGAERAYRRAEKRDKRSSGGVVG